MSEFVRIVRAGGRLLAPSLVVGALVTATAACGKSSSPAPTAPSAPSTFTVSGTVTSFGTGGPLAGVRVEIAGGAVVTTDGAGRYSFPGLSSGSITVRATAERFKENARAVAVSSNQTVDLALRRAPCSGAEVSCGLGPSPCNETMPMLQKPFAGDFNTRGSFDHDLPLGVTASQPGEYISFCGATGTGGLVVNGLGWWNFELPNGTPVLAAAAGTVTSAGDREPTPCPVTGGTVVTRRVEIEHRSPFGERIWTQYNGLETLDVAVGQSVAAGQVIGVSGDRGCQARPLLGFVTSRERGNNGNGRFATDPFGWQGPGESPWANAANGAPSVWLWSTPPTRFTPLN